ncbi:MAG: hypothetical protein ACKOQ9_03120, partial [Verrucomicrobiota bacterium]
MADARSIALVCANEASLWAELPARAEKIAADEPALAPILRRFVLDRASLGGGELIRAGAHLRPQGGRMGADQADGTGVSHRRKR